MTPISKELQDQIEREAEIYNKTPREYIGGQQGYIDGATAYAHYKERCEAMEANLKYIKTQIGQIELNSGNIQLVQEANNAINFAMAGADYTQTLASWKEEGKEGIHG